MHAHEHHVGDPALFEQAPDLDARIADRVLVANGQSGMLALPRSFRVPVQRFQLGVPLRVFRRVVVLAAVRLIDRVLPFLLGGNLGTPLVNRLGQVLGRRSSLGSPPRRMVLVGVHATRRRVDDEGALSPRLRQELVHPGDHLLFPADRIQAVMGVPHVADDDGRLLGRPGLCPCGHLVLPILLRPRTQGQRELGFISPGD